MNEIVKARKGPIALRRVSLRDNRAVDALLKIPTKRGEIFRGQQLPGRPEIVLDVLGQRAIAELGGARIVGARKLIVAIDEILDIAARRLISTDGPRWRTDLDGLSGRFQIYDLRLYRPWTVDGDIASIVVRGDPAKIAE